MFTNAGCVLGKLLVTVLSLLVLVTAVGVACGGSADDSYVGYWRIAPSAFIDYKLLEVRPSGDAYRVRFDTYAPHEAKIVNGLLRLQESYHKGSMYAPELDLQLRDGNDTILASASPSPAPYKVTRLTEQQYRAKLNAMADDQLKMLLFGLSQLAKEWSAKHGAPPAAGDMNPDSDFGRYVAQRIVSWPWNPFTGADMHAGSEPGDFSYTTDGRSFTLTATSSDGSSVSP
jgi:hypothetical protein